MWPAIPFFASAVLLAAFFVLRGLEEKRNSKFFPEKREKADRIVSVVYARLVEGNIPKEYRKLLTAFIRRALHETAVILMKTLRALEAPLQRFSHRMRMAAHKESEREVSPFLKTITPERSEGKGTSDSLSSHVMGARVPLTPEKKNGEGNGKVTNDSV